MKRNISKALSLMTVLGYMVLSTSCSKHDENSPGVEFMPDMYRSPSIETNLSTVIDNGDGTYDTVISNREPVKGTVARGYIPYKYENTPAGYEAAGVELKNPLEKSAPILEKGMALYNTYCDHCHGASGEGDGLVAAKLPGPPPSFKGLLKSLPEGKIFHSVTYGKGMMGSHSGQLTQEERWKVVMYVQKLQGVGAPEAPVVDSVATPPVK